MLRKVVLLAVMLAMVLAVTIPAAAGGNTGNFVNQQGSVTYGAKGNVVEIGDTQFGEQRLLSGDIINDSIVMADYLGYLDSILQGLY
jgi:hypothetical protein